MRSDCPTCWPDALCGFCELMWIHFMLEVNAALEEAERIVRGDA